MVKIISETEVKRLTCSGCSRVLEYTQSDVSECVIDQELIKFIACPACSKKIRVESYEYLIIYMVGSLTGRFTVRTSELISTYEDIQNVDRVAESMTGIGKVLLTDFKLLREVHDMPEKF